MEALQHFLGNVVTYLIQPVIGLLFALALYFFVIGGVQFIAKSADPKGRETGRQRLIWGLVGLFIMVAVIPILAVITNTFCGSFFCR